MKKITLMLLLLTFPLLMGSSNYNYSFYKESVYSVPGMTFSQYFNEHTLDTKFSKPAYFTIYDEKIYLIDSGNHSLYVIDSDFQLLDGPLNTFNIHPDSVDKEVFKDITTIKFSAPEGLEVTSDYIYVADTQNRRVVKMTLDYQVVDLFKDPVDPVFKDANKVAEEAERKRLHDELQATLPEEERTEFVPEEIPGILFLPSKITVDNTERMYIIAKDVYEGIVELSPEGEFNRFTGVNPLVLTPAEIFRRSLMSEAQKAKLKTYLPTSFTSVRMGDGNFIYATSMASDNNDQNMIQLINPKGLDVIKRNGYVVPMGDAQYIKEMNNYVTDGPSELVDIDYTKGGIYSVLDKKRSRIFTYDSEGNLLYITGSEGDQSDKFKSGVSLGYLNDQMIVLDQNNKTFIVYKLSNFGALVNQAVSLEYEGNYADSRDVWEEVVRLNVNYEIAYSGIGRYYLREGNFKEAVEYFKLGHNSYYYSKAFQNYRNEILRDNFGWIFGGIMLLAGLFVGRSIYKKRQRRNEDDDEV